MGEASSRTVSDGLPARDADTWTEEKLRILDCYAGGFAKTTQKAGGWYGLDPFAGAGLNYSLTQSVEIPGSPLVMLNAGSPEATEVIMCEADAETRRVLEARVEPYEPRGVVFPGDADTAIRGMLDRIPRPAPAFAFLDPEGSELAWETIVAIADHKRETVLDRQITKASGQPMYFLTFATDHEAGERIMDHCFDRVELKLEPLARQARLFAPPPRRKRLSDS